MVHYLDSGVSIDPCTQSIALVLLHSMYYILPEKYLCFKLFPCL